MQRDCDQFMNIKRVIIKVYNDILVNTSELKTRNALYKNYQKYILYL